MTEQHISAGSARLSSIVFNSADPRRLADFWAELLSLAEESTVGDDDFIWLAAAGAGQPKFAFQKVESPSEGPRRLHLDVEADDADVLLQRSLNLGATVKERHAYPGFSWTVMLDVDGNEFCIPHPDEQAGH